MSAETMRAEIGMMLVEIEDVAKRYGRDASRMTLLIRDERGPEESILLTADDDLAEAAKTIEALATDGIVTEAR